MKLASKTDKWKGERPLARIENCSSPDECQSKSFEKMNTLLSAILKMLLKITLPGSAPDPVGGAFSTPLNPLADVTCLATLYNKTLLIKMQ